MIFLGTPSLEVVLPSRPVEQQHGASACRDMARDFIEMKLHRLGVGVRERQRRADSARRANRAVGAKNRTSKAISGNAHFCRKVTTFLSQVEVRR